MQPTNLGQLFDAALNLRAACDAGTSEASSSAAISRLALDLTSPQWAAYGLWRANQSNGWNGLRANSQIQARLSKTPSLVARSIHGSAPQLTRKGSSTWHLHPSVPHSVLGAESARESSPAISKEIAGMILERWEVILE
jgi:hypothetical protein